MLGGGSNLLLTADYPGTVLHSAIRGIVPSDDGDSVLVRVGSGEDWDGFVGTCVANGWYGAENLSLIPGEVGASAVQNIGAYGVEAKDLIYEVEAVSLADGSLERFNNADCEYAYRHSRFKGEWTGRYVITHVTFRLGKQFRPHLDYGNIRAELQKRGIVVPTAGQLRQVVIDIRNAKLPDPKVLGNAGSFFKNPVVSEEQAAKLLARWPDMPRYGAGEGFVKLAAGWLIDRCGWKGRRMGPVGVHDRQALVLVHYGGGTGADVMRLARAVQRDVAERFGVRIDMEVNLL